jgi:flagellar assembly protein FliH
MGTPKPIKNTLTTIIKKEPVIKTVKSQEEIMQESEKQSSKIIEEAKEMYLKIIDEANCEAKNIKEKTQLEAENQAQLTRQSGYNEGYEAGFEKGLSEAGSIIEASSDIRDFLESRINLINSQAEEEIVAMILEIAKKVIGDELKQNKDAIFSVVKQAIEKSTFKSTLVLRVSEEDFENVTRNRDLILKLTEGLKELDIQKDLSLQSGSCIVETPSGDINSSVEVQLQEIKKAFIYVLRNE